MVSQSRMNDYPMKVYDLCIVGAGMIGSSAARHASLNPQTRVCLVGTTEPQFRDHTRDIYGSYYDEARMTMTTDNDYIWAALNRRSYARYRQLEKETGISFFNEVGSILFGRGDGTYMKNVFETTERQNETGRKVSAKDIKEAFPCMHVSRADVGFLQLESAGYVNPRRFVLAQQMAARQQGCDLLNDVVDQVNQVSQSGGGSLMQIKTASGESIWAKRVLLATGAFTNFRKLLPSGVVPDIDYMTGSVVLAELSEKDAESLSNLPAMVYDGTAYDESLQYLDKGKFEIYFLPPIRYPDGKFYVKMGPGVRFKRSLPSNHAITDWFCNPANEASTTQVKTWLKNMFPGVKFQSFKTDTCVISLSRSGRPYIDLIHRRLGVALGGCGSAGKACDEIGRMAAELVLDGSWEHDLPEEAFKFLPKTPTNVSKL